MSDTNQSSDTKERWHASFRAHYGIPEGMRRLYGIDLPQADYDRLVKPAKKLCREGGAAMAQEYLRREIEHGPAQTDRRHVASVSEPVMQRSIRMTPKRIKCLCCRNEFKSEWAGNRLCDLCIAEA